MSSCCRTSNEGGEIEFNRNRSTLLAVLRCQIDKGRWYFPNIHTDKKRAWKLPAFRGIRQPIIDVLVDIYEAAKTADWSTRAPAHQRVEDLHRKFVSEVPHRLNPSERDANYHRYVEQVSAQFVEESLLRPDRTRAVPSPRRKLSIEVGWRGHSGWQPATRCREWPGVSVAMGKCSLFSPPRTGQPTRITAS